MYKVYSWALVLNVKHYFKLHFFVLIEETETEKKKKPTKWSTISMSSC